MPRNAFVVQIERNAPAYRPLMSVVAKVIVSGPFWSVAESRTAEVEKADERAKDLAERVERIISIDLDRANGFGIARDEGVRQFRIVSEPGARTLKLRCEKCSSEIAFVGVMDAQDVNVWMDQHEGIGAWVAKCGAKR